MSVTQRQRRRNSFAARERRPNELTFIVHRTGEQKCIEIATSRGARMVCVPLPVLVALLATTTTYVLGSLHFDSTSHTGHKQQRTRAQHSPNVSIHFTLSKHNRPHAHSHIPYKIGGVVGYPEAGVERSSAECADAMPIRLIWVLPPRVGRTTATTKKTHGNTHANTHTHKRTAQKQTTHTLLFI